MKKDQLIQYAALCYRVEDGHPLVALVTSRETKRWILPKGQPEKGVPPCEVAEHEAYEEAGLTGKVKRRAFASFASTKRLKTGTEVPCTIKVFLVEVRRELDVWPEKHERERRWVTPGEAALMVGEAGLVTVLLSFSAQWD
ncbi:MAG: NUDIX hydrolase [Magnetospirillum sp.]|nr:NUDIX hydrolase [Magnetospirillum sp.]